jgi:predicted transposase YbfD/YdcC
MQRKAATTKGMERRIRDLKLERVRDPRYAPNVDHPLPAMLAGVVASMATRAHSLRVVEQRTAQIAKQHNSWLGIDGRIADNTIGKVLSRLDRRDLTRRLVDLVKAELRRGNLEPTVFPVATIAIDGKNVATLHWPDLCRVLELDPRTARVPQVRKLLKERFPDAQLCVPKKDKGPQVNNSTESTLRRRPCPSRRPTAKADDRSSSSLACRRPYALMRVHTVTLISSSAACCVYQRAIPGKTNEIGAMPDLLTELHRTYGRTGLYDMVTTDAGNTSLKVQTLIVKKLHRDYFAQIKVEHGELYAEAERALGGRKAAEAEARYADNQNGKTVTYQVWRYDLSVKGWLDWKHARQLVRVQRITEEPATGKKTIGNRYYVSSRPTTTLSANDALKISRLHWRCEEETHWTADAMLLEDKRRPSWSRHPVGVFVVSLLRMMALNILAVARKLSRLGYGEETPTWRQVAEHFLLVLCAATLNTEAFDAVNE